MIYWSFDDFSRLPASSGFADPLKWLGKSEAAELARLRVPKRRLEWMGSRFAVKKLLRSANPELGALDFKRLELMKEPGGAPFIEVEGRRVPGCITLSHSNGWGLCAWSSDQIQLGIDLEKIENRPVEFVADYFTVHEMEQVNQAHLTDQPLAATLIWSAKESVLKALGTGLALDTRKIEIELTMETANQSQTWQRLGLNCAVKETPSLHLFWKREGDFVQTISFSAVPNPEMIQVNFLPKTFGEHTAALQV